MTTEEKPAWSCMISLRIVNEKLDPIVITKKLGVTPSVAHQPGTSKIHHGTSDSAGYWCGEMTFHYPDRPNLAIDWVEDQAKRNRDFLEQLVSDGAAITTYLGIHCNVMNVGFVVPPTPNLSNLGILLGIEFFGR